MASLLLFSQQAAAMEFLVVKVPRTVFSISGMLEILERLGKGLDILRRMRTSRN
jgi:hypothetical protein